MFDRQTDRHTLFRLVHSTSSIYITCSLFHIKLSREQISYKIQIRVNIIEKCEHSVTMAESDLSNRIHIVDFIQLCRKCRI